MGIVRFIGFICLYPFSLLYDLITRIRNYLYDHGYLKSFQFDIPVISVGNLKVGGTGKTPHVEHLVELFVSNQIKVAVLSRGYGRVTRGILHADETSTASRIGDEPMQYYVKYGHQISVHVGEDRLLAIPALLAKEDKTEVILLDDAFQHRTVKPTLNILITQYNNLFTNDYLLPAGRLREARMGAKRADIVIVSKCPDDITNEIMTTVIKDIKKYTHSEAKIFFSKFQYSPPVCLYSSTGIKCSFRLIVCTGIANPELLYNHLEQQGYELVKKIRFKDHHRYTLRDAAFIRKCYEQHKQKDVSVLITEKDMVKLLDHSIKNELSDVPIFYLPVKIALINSEQEYQSIVLSKVKR
ncbi:MAG: tetraacyldisaccharide 4'-kinase [Cytophagaceae bacterium]|nr:tetraacyldisaccharide 4'-kinase [Cytophagaceae bacterium]MDW8457187.1 tetraacyldisaccharide 4'-kinase [Cytophagaceae bacterium]